MELMSSLLFCALVTHLPQALGENKEALSRNADILDIKFNNSRMIKQISMPKKILLNINGPPLVNMVSDLQTVFMDYNCRDCIDCMERAIKAYKSHYHVTKTRPRTDELHEEVLKNRIMVRNKRETSTMETTVNLKKKNKSKKKTSKSVTVTKYNDHGEVYALKVKETQANAELNDTQVSCQVYRVKKSSPCDTPEGDSFLTVAKRKSNKKTKKDKDETKVATTASTTRAHFLAPVFRKRQVDNSQVPESYMTSIEEMY